MTLWVHAISLPAPSGSYNPSASVRGGDGSYRDDQWLLMIHGSWVQPVGILANCPDLIDLFQFLTFQNAKNRNFPISEFSKCEKKYWL